MGVRVFESYIPMQELEAMFEKSNNIESVHFLAYQCGCPMYLITNTDGLCQIMWHPDKDPEKDVMHFKMVEGKLETEYSGEIQDWEKLEDIQQCRIGYLIKDCTLTKKCAVWSRKN